MARSRAQGLSAIVAGKGWLTARPPRLVGRPSQGLVGQPFAFTPSVRHGSGARTFSLAGSLPAGLSFSASTGAITGTPTAAGTTSGLAITVTDSAGSSTLPGIAIVVAPIVDPFDPNANVEPITVGRALTVADMGKVLRVDGAAAVSFTLPADLPEGFNVGITRAGAGAVSFSTATGATNRSSKTSISAQYGFASLIVSKNANGVSAEYLVKGDVA